MGLIDILLLPKKYFQGITDKRSSLYAGIVFVGAIDILFPEVRSILLKLFIGKTGSVLLYNTALLLVFMILLGVLDVVFFSVPLFDLFKVFKKKSDSPVASGHKIRIMKIYIIAHIVVLPVNIILQFVFSNVTLQTNPALAYTAFFIGILVIIWFSAIISRGINVIYSFEEFFKRLVFAVVFLWNFLLGSAIRFIIDNWAMMLFK